MDCVTLHLQLVFADNSVEKECYYNGNILKKLQQLEQLSSYLLHIPSMYDGPQVTANISKIKSYDQAELAYFALCIHPKTWHDQYDLMQDLMAPQSMRKLLAVLKTIEKMMEHQAMKEKGKSAKQENKTDSEKSGKRKKYKFLYWLHPKGKILSVVQGAQRTSQDTQHEW